MLQTKQRETPGCHASYCRLVLKIVKPPKNACILPLGQYFSTCK